MITILKLKTHPDTDPRDAHIAAMWLMFLRAPEGQTAPGEPVDLGEIGACREKNWSKATPYSLAKPR